jgi:cell division protein FtsW (lipid II flippase)
VNWILGKPNSNQDVIQSRLFSLAVLFHLIGSVILTLAPVVRYHSWLADLRWQQWIGFIVWFASFVFFYRILTRVLPDRDPYILPIVSLLTAWGLLTIYRLDPSTGFRQTIWLAIGIILLTVIIRFKNGLDFLRRYKYIWLILGLLLTLLTFIVGVYPGGIGPSLWLNFFGVFFQPSEILKILLVIFLAGYFADNVGIRFSLPRLLTPTLVLVGAAFLILVAQHDLGTATLLIGIYAGIIYLASGKRRLLLISAVVVVVALSIGYQVFDVIQLRIEAWLNPWLDPNGRSYQIVQSIIAIANGGLFGRGIGLGSPSVVPVAQSDFIFPAIFEETGLLGAAGIILLYAFFMIRGFTIALQSPNQFQRYLAAGLTLAITVQAILIIGGSIRMLPLTGVTLPFVSYGGSSLLMGFISIALLLLVSNQPDKLPANLEYSQPFRLVSTVFLVLFSVLILISTWWSLIRADDLLSRNDNPRRFISDRYVLRGSIFAQDNQVLVSTIGEAGNFSNYLSYPKLSSVIGYSDSNYGQAGLEFSQDLLLRGVSPENYWQVFTSRLLFGQYPQGFDIRTSIDLDLQKKVDAYLGNSQGSILVMNSDSGEILALATSPTFDSNDLAGNMESWKSDPSSPLLNRATQGLYPPGSITGGLIFNYLLSTGDNLPGLPTFPISTELNNTYYCADQSGSQLTWEEFISAGCPFALDQMSSVINSVGLYNIYKRYGLLDQPDIQIESVLPVNIGAFGDKVSLFNGNANLLVTPLQVAMAYAPFSNKGYFVEPSIAEAYRSSDGTWQLIPSFSEKEKSQIKITSELPSSSLAPGLGWQLSATVPTETGTLDWFVMGTTQNWQGVPIIIVIAIEDSTPAKAQSKGISTYLAATNQ